MYRQFMSSSCTLAQVCVGILPSVYTAGTAGICIQVCAGAGTGTDTDFRTGTGRFRNGGTTSIPVRQTSVSLVRHQTDTGTDFRTGNRTLR